MGHAAYQWPNSWKTSCVAVRLELSKGGDVGFLMKLTVSLMCGVPTSSRSWLNKKHGIFPNITRTSCQGENK